MNGYTKVDNGIIDSSIWCEDSDTRCVWMTMLFTADLNDNVKCSLPGLAKKANVGIDVCEKALKKFLSPDRYSRSKEYKGRRIEEIDGGWHILNRDLYRKKDYSRADYFKEWRKNRNISNEQKVKEVQMSGARMAVSHNTECSTNSECNNIQQKHNTECSANSSCNTVNSKDIIIKKNKENTLNDFEVFWKAYPRKVGKGKVRNWWLKHKPDKDLQSKILKAIEQQKKTPQWQKDGGQFIPHPITWLNQERWDDEVKNGYRSGVSQNVRGGQGQAGGGPYRRPVSQPPESKIGDVI